MKINGEIYDFQGEVTVADVIEKLGYEISQVAVELNLEIVPRSEFLTKVLNENDSLEVVRFVGGG